MADEVVVMTAKPKTGKAIMTDEEILFGKEDEDGFFRLCKETMLYLLAQARQQGIAEERQRGMRIWHTR